MPIPDSTPSVSDKAVESYPTLEFHLRGALEPIYPLSLPVFALENGQFKIAFNELQNLIHSLNQSASEKDLQSSEFHGLGLLTLLSHKIIRLYRNQVNPAYIEGLTEFLADRFDPSGLDAILVDYLTSMPSKVFRDSGLAVEAFVQGVSGNIPNREIVVEELLVHLLALENPAFQKYEVMFKESFNVEIENSTGLLNAIQLWSNEFVGLGSSKKNIIDLLMEPALSAPNSIEEQLAYIRSNWTNYIGSHLGDILRGLDHFEEENRFRGHGPGESQVPHYSGDLLEGEFFSEDSDWMPRVVMIARNSLVWLDQLSKKYGRAIQTLQDIPDQELDHLAQQGFNVLWLIGLWHRSSVSKKIKHWCGNPDAESSAYSLKSYHIDPSIGGPEALENLKERAWERGIRLASDMVPNHTGLDSDWIKDHPDWYISSSEPPFPAYTFNGGNLSEDPDSSIQIEDHYYDRSDASVVFKHQDHRNGETRYIYHGNDGTSMPWNDTAQLNYLNPELREAIIQTILDVARQFKVIRFDAAMTLAKRHIQRLWFPEPGSGGDIPSRSNHSMSGADFNAAIPLEFWREVVDRVAKEVPDTLLLAEAFWMMEGYFVRTLGMHRVYNSAFMNMLKMEENSKFFEMISTTLAFDPRILQRFVNFLSNPDEDTAIAQFGKGDKYFGATLLMVTLPGLPMFAHAQIEGYEEKYGMEYRRAYWDESPDEDLVARHERLIFPLMKKRYLFAGARNFRLFPMFGASGEQISSIFAYTNRNGTERSLILVNNAYENQSGWIKISVPVNQDPTADQANLVTEDLILALSFDVGNTYFIIFQEQTSKLWYIRSVSEIREQGLYLELSGYESQVYLNFQLVSDTQSNPWSAIYDELAGQGITDFGPMFRSIELEPVKVLYAKFMKFIGDTERSEWKAELFPRFAPLLEAMLEVDNRTLEFEEIEGHANRFIEDYDTFRSYQDSVGDPNLNRNIYLIATMLLGRQIGKTNPDSEMSMVRAFELQAELAKLIDLDSDSNMSELYPVLECADQSRHLLPEQIGAFFQLLFRCEDVKQYFKVHEVEGTIWFKQEPMNLFLESIPILLGGKMTQAQLKLIHEAVTSSEYQLVKFLDFLNDEKDHSSP